METDIDRVLIPRTELLARVDELGAQLRLEYASSTPIFLGVLNGAMMFLADLIRACQIPMTLDVMAVSSYAGSTRSSGAVRILKDLDRNIEGRNVIVVEDIVDTGLTLSYLLDNLRARQPSSIKVCALLDKRERRTVDVELDWIGFEIPDLFVVGYGLDFRDLYRNLPYIGVLKPHLYSE